jgi:DNA-directed RNA polymerase subunit RPC12/RpoP
MGSASNYTCHNCGAKLEFITPDFDYGFSAEVTTPVVCAEHGVQQADTGLMAWDRGWDERKQPSYPCPECGRDSHLWDHRTCPVCGKRRMREDLNKGIFWD